MTELSRDELLRYSRHLVLPGLGLEGQRKLKVARVLIIGAGGLGRRRRSISPRPGWGRSGSSIPTGWT